MAAVVEDHQLALQTVQTSAGAQLRRWVTSEQGQRVWARMGRLPSVEIVCHALEVTRAPSINAG